MPRVRPTSATGMLSNIEWPLASDFDGDLGRAKIIEFIEKVASRLLKSKVEGVTISDLALRSAVALLCGAVVQRSADD